jgi:hypothetical protein
MPPSGYSLQQANYINAFLKSCAEALEREANESAQGIPTRLAAEIADIKRYLNAGNAASNAQIPVLELTRSFYQGVASRVPTTHLEFWAAVDDTLVQLRQSILAIHIEPVHLPSGLVPS